jgi:hypothetical protein
MKRREFIERAGFGSAALAVPAAIGKTRTDVKEEGHAHGADRDDVKGPLANATVSFGAWDLDSPLDRFPNNSPRTRNYHELIPSEATIKAGGSVNFIISGFHHLLVYGDGTKPEDINLTLLASVTVPPGPPLINDPTNRVYRGLDPSVLPQLPGSTPTQQLQDRVEVVRFPNPGRYLVMCGVLPHFFDAATGQFVMFGYVRVLP